MYNVHPFQKQSNDSLCLTSFCRDYQMLITKNVDINHEKCVIQEHLSPIATTVIGKRMYSQELIVRVFQYFETSRILYNRLIIDLSIKNTDKIKIESINFK